MDRIKAVADKHGVRILEDACQAIGGSYHGRRLASIGDAGAFSFNQFKIVTCGEGGALLTSNRKIFERALYYHDMGCTFRGHAGEMTETPFLGNTFRMNEVLGAILRVQFERLDGILARLRERRDWILDAVRTAKAPFRISPSADLAGDCGSHATFLFRTAQERVRVAARAKELNASCGLGSPIDSGLHVYTNWAVLLNQQGGHHPDLNPFLMPQNRDCRLKITADCCPRTLDILAKTGAIAVNIGWSRDQCEGMAHALCTAAREGVK
jgi:dTDP-4-amino-4,6-dideoxygalactose transaminase